MKIITLSSSDKRFKAIDFNDGLNIIVGKKILNDDKKTSNGIGKSLSLICIDYLLGKGIKNPSKEIKNLKKILEDNNIYLSLIFEHNGITYNVKRSHNKISLDDKDYEKETEYLDFLNNIISSDYTFRNIFSRFFRTDKTSYNDAIKQVYSEKSYNNNLINSYLLGLNLEFLLKKKSLKEKNDRLKTLIKELNVLQKSIDKEKEIEFEEKLKKIEKHLNSFEIAEDFNELKKEADIVTSELQKIRNKIAYFNREIRNKNLILSSSNQVELDTNKISNMYEEAKFFLGEETLAHINAVKDFHRTLFENRKIKAKKDIESFEEEINKLKSTEKEKDKRRSEIFKYLENKGALEEYHSLNSEKENIKGYLEDIQRNKKSLISFKKEKADIKIEIDKFKRELIELDEKIKDQIDLLRKIFRQISEEHYKSNPGLLDIEINDNFNTEKLYNIEPIIKGDSSDGINEMKIFIYDMLIYKLNKNLVGLVGHDNRLFDMVDERQIAKAFNYSMNNTKQYICSISDVKLTEAQKYSSINLDKKIVRNLNENDKLFGFDFE